MICSFIENFPILLTSSTLCISLLLLLFVYFYWYDDDIVIIYIYKEKKKKEIFVFQRNGTRIYRSTTMISTAKT